MMFINSNLVTVPVSIFKDQQFLDGRRNETKEAEDPTEKKKRKRDIETEEDHVKK